jgi:NAD(P)-dependent dehydrogenase (short-subunit alcohol dehydrogenase family)
MAGCQAVVEAAIESFGRLDILINNAGISSPARIDRMSEAQFDDIIAVNLKGCFGTIKYAAEYLKERGGTIINMSSPSGFGHYGMSNYASAKEGIVGLTRSVARDLGEFDIKCYAVRPSAGNSAMATPEVLETLRYSTEELNIPFVSHMWLSDIDGRPENVAALLAWLCMPEAESLNGREIYVAGSHVALIQEPEFIRSQFRAGGWDLNSLLTPETTAALTWGLRNRYSKQTRSGGVK